MSSLQAQEHSSRRQVSRHQHSETPLCVALRLLFANRTPNSTIQSRPGKFVDRGSELSHAYRKSLANCTCPSICPYALTSHRRSTAKPHGTVFRQLLPFIHIKLKEQMLNTDRSAYFRACRSGHKPPTAPNVLAASVSSRQLACLQPPCNNSSQTLDRISATSGDSSTFFAHEYYSQHARPQRRQLVATAALPNTATGAAITQRTSFAWSSYVSRRINLDLAIDEAIAGATKHQPEDWAPELAIVFLSSAYVAEYDQLLQLLRSKIPSLKHVFGSTGYGVIGSTDDGPEEIEHAPSLSLTLASLPGVHVSIQHVTKEQLPDGDAPPNVWADLVGAQLDSEADDTSFVILSDSDFSEVMDLTAGLDFAFPAANKIGGLVSAGKLSPARAMFAWSQQANGQHQQLQQRQLEQQGQHHDQPQQPLGQQQPQQAVLQTGAVVMSLQGPVRMELLVAQGCRPLSDRVYTVDKTASISSVVFGLRDAAGRVATPVQALKTELRQVSKDDAEMMNLLRNMALGLMPDMLRASGTAPLEPHDFLIRGMALDRSGCMVVGDSVRVGQQIRFMVRDREGAQQDLTSHCLAYKRRELAASMSGQSQPQAFGMLLFSCNGRGMNLYDEPSFDSRTLASYIPVPCAGFMCNGEIGSLGGATHLHGFTCAAAVLRAAPPATSADYP